jgi:hypothetical protein
MDSSEVCRYSVPAQPTSRMLQGYRSRFLVLAGLALLDSSKGKISAEEDKVGSDPLPTPTSRSLEDRLHDTLDNCLDVS